MADLLPCPFCGTAPIVIAGIIGCPECASGQPNAERWNTRAAPEAAKLEEMREALKPFAHYCELNDLLTSGDPERVIEVPVSDLQRAHAALTGSRT